MTRAVVVLTGPQRPHELLLLAVGVLSTIGYIAGGPPPGSITATLPGWAVVAFYILFGAGSAIGLAGCALHRRSIGPGLEQGGLLLQAAGLALYAPAIVVYSGSRGWVIVLVLVAWTCANVWRALQIQRDLNARAAPR